MANRKWSMAGLSRRVTKRPPGGLSRASSLLQGVALSL
ncbi:hypothetical protein C4K25_2148 [Pseudomonas chlororaphis]|nr:hypothetical protein C4K25_2148 [Pseudomonas chlororaphis]